MSRRSSLLASAGKGGGGGSSNRRESNGNFDLGLLDQDDVISFDDDDDERTAWKWSRQGVASIAVALLALFMIGNMLPGVWNMHKIARERGSLLHHRHPQGVNVSSLFSGIGRTSGLSEAQVLKLFEKQLEKTTKEIEDKVTKIQISLDDVKKQQETFPKEEDLKAQFSAQIKIEFPDERLKEIAAESIGKAEEAASSSNMAPEQAEKIISESKEQAKVLDQKKNELEGLVKTLSDLLTDVKKFQQEGDIVKMTEEAKILGDRTRQNIEEINQVMKTFKDESHQPHGKIAELNKTIADAKEVKAAMEEGLKTLQKESVKVNQVLDMAKAEKKAMDENREDFQSMLEKINQSIEEVRKMSSKTDVQGLLDETSKIKDEIKKKEESLTARMSEVNTTLEHLRQIESHALPEKVAKETKKVAQELQDELDAIKDQAKVLEDLVTTVQEERTRLQELTEGALVVASQQNATSATAAAGAAGSSLKPGERVVTKAELKNVIKEVIKEQGVGKAAAAVPASVSSAGQQSITDAACIAAIEESVEKAVRKFEADETGLVDYAAAVSGGSVLKSLSSPTYTPRGYVIPTEWYHNLGLNTNIAPRQIAISSGHKKPGDCWPFPGSQGKLAVRLHEPIVPTNVSLEHIPKEITRVPSTAPKEFRILGLTDEPGAEPIQLHSQPSFQYQINQGRVVQTLPLNAVHGQTFSIITLEVLNNWGHNEFTCIYRFRVHGEAPSPAF